MSYSPKWLFRQRYPNSHPIDVSGIDSLKGTSRQIEISSYTRALQGLGLFCPSYLARTRPALQGVLGE